MIRRWLALTYYLYALRLAALSHFYFNPLYPEKPSPQASPTGEGVSGCCATVCRITHKKQPALFAGRIQFQYPCRIIRPSFCQSSSFAQTKCRLLSNMPKAACTFYLSDIFKQNLRQSSSRPFLRCWFAHGSRQTVRDRCRACF